MSYSEEERRRDDKDWHQTKGIALTIIILLITNIGASIWWAASLTSDVGVIKDQVKEQPEIVERIIKLETITELMQGTFGRYIEALHDIEQTVARIDREQARRKSIIDAVEKQFENKR